MGKEKINVLIIGKRTSFNNALADVIGSIKSYSVTSKSYRKAKESPFINYGLVFIDLTASNGKIREIIGEVKSEHPLSRLIALHHKNSENMIANTLSAGADAFLPTDMTNDQLIDTLKQLPLPTTNH